MARGTPNKVIGTSSGRTVAFVSGWFLVRDFGDYRLTYDDRRAHTL
jgi:hypothetical protein